MVSLTRLSATIASLLLMFHSPAAVAATYHVAQRGETADDSNPGTPSRPWKTLARAMRDLRAGDTLSVYPGNGPGGLTGRTALGFDAARYDWVLGVSDLRLTGHGDLVVREKASGRLYALTVTAKKGITSRRLLGQGMEVYDRAG